ncbi:acetyl-CoA synthetase-like protein [Sporormia fimetaria CBS 119925]|uniref:Acetyl-CoA synthetase-like protein n=1 Tax=Sporormia fimetaria CBS 119925 TaxID=1340428 RepID=A0A6A6UWE8_9PLEO|nr:acetyl-CoA synthetase-like protein [Sporormia fimetaria CBS 119925]
MPALPIALPLAAASLAYLNARHSITYDFRLLRAYISSLVLGAKRHDRNDDINLFYRLEQHAQSSNANSTWIIFEDRRYTYAQAYDIVLKYGTWLKSKGVQKDEVVAMDFMNSEVFVWMWYGLWSIGAKPAFINYNLTGKPLLHTIKTSGARLVIVGEEGRERYAEDVMSEGGFSAVQTGSNSGAFGRQAHYGYDGEVAAGLSEKPAGDVALGMATQGQAKKLEVLFFDRGLEQQILSLQPVRQPNSERGGQQQKDMAILIYTSGTTGLPKPAIVSWSKATLGSNLVALWIPLTPKETVYTSMPLYHSSASVLGVCSVLQGGAAICLSKKFSHKTFWPEIRASNATIIHYVGETCRYLLSAPPNPMDKNHSVHSAFGNGLRPDVWDAFKDRFGISTILEFYAATEAPGAMWNRSTNSFSAGAIGRNGTLASLLMGGAMKLIKMDPESDPPEPLRNVNTGLCQQAAYGEAGELFYKLDPENISMKFQGYYGNEKATNSKIVRNVMVKGDAYFRTGDLMKKDEEGRWYFMDRTGDTYRWKAENVSTAEVSEAVGRHPEVQEANVYGVLVPQHDGRAGCAAVILKGEADERVLSSLGEHVGKSLPGFAAPLFLRITKEMHTTGTNKQQKGTFQKEGIEVQTVEGTGDRLFWLRDGKYVAFGEQDLAAIKKGTVKL